MDHNPKGAIVGLIETASKEIVEMVILKYKRHYSDHEIKLEVKNLLDKMIRDMLALSKSTKNATPEQKS